MPPRSSQKRAATNSNAEAATSKHAAKKTRFEDPSEDPENFAEEVESALEDPVARRKGRVKIEGYESDSSDDGEGVVESRKKDSARGNDDDDMFAMADKDGKDDEVTGKKKKKETYMRLGDIEGQEFNSASGSDDEPESDPEDEDDAERRKKAGMGYEMSSFNMREEMEEGKFTEDGNYVRTFDPHGIHDRWMEGLSEKEIKLARKRKRQQDKIQRDRLEAEEKELQESGGKAALELQLLPMLKKGEMVLEALQRLGNQKNRKSKGNISIERHDNEAAKSSSDIETITRLASNIMSLGETDIYSKTYEELVRSVRSSGVVDAAWEPPSANVRYEYKWVVANDGQRGDVFGPFSEEDMGSWMQASYFGTAGEKINVRPEGGDWGEWNDFFS